MSPWHHHYLKGHLKWDRKVDDDFGELEESDNGLVLPNSSALKSHP